jgi:hypothetical protein
MKKLTFNFAFLLMLLVLSGCQKETDIVNSGTGNILKKAGNKTFYGETQELGDGTVRAWTMFNDAGIAVEVGVNISAVAMNSLPAHQVDLSLAFHPVKNSGTFTHLYLNWGPQGHAPIGIYNVPHFDVHFYTQSEAARLAITPGNPAFAIHPAPGYLPAMHIPTSAIPQMGQHWAYLLSPELNGVPFTNTFLYGSYDGAVTFYEPMITRVWMMAQTHTVVAIPQPAAVQQDGYYPTEYYVAYTTNPGTYTVALKLAFRTGE